MYVEFWYNGCAVPPIPAAEGGGVMEYMFNFFVSVAANVVASLVSKWLERHRRGQ